MSYKVIAGKKPSLSFSIKKSESLVKQSVSQVLRGYSAYEIAVQHGFVGTEEEWLASLVEDLPAATAERLGVVRSSSTENGVVVASDGSMEVMSLNVNRLIQTDGDVLVLKGGNL